MQKDEIQTNTITSTEFALNLKSGFMLLINSTLLIVTEMFMFTVYVLCLPPMKLLELLFRIKSTLKFLSLRGMREGEENEDMSIEKKIINISGTNYMLVSYPN